MKENTQTLHILTDKYLHLNKLENRGILYEHLGDVG